jgi:triosephosphate isomerase
MSRRVELTSLKEWYYQVHQGYSRQPEQGQARSQDRCVQSTTSPSTKSIPLTHHLEVVIAPPTIYLSLAREHLREGLEVAAQNIYDKPSGAFTGEISADQLKDSGITWTILGHSERRVILKEDDQFVASKTKAALDAGVSVILCCGESLEQREAGKTIEVVTTQLKAVADVVKDWSKVVVAYEPIWCVLNSFTTYIMR